MICFSCGVEIEDEDICPACGANQGVYKKIIYASNKAYNEGISRAKIRDLSGAADLLNKSLRLNKYNIEARNLLGLVYFEVGQTVLALREWVLSKNLKPDDNPVDEYLSRVQKPGVLNKLDSTTQKYNQALEYCRQGSRDLAKIQLKRVVSVNPKLVSAYQLLALILMQDGKYEEARKYLSEAGRIDYKNALTMAYTREVRRVLSKRTKKRKKKRELETNDLSDIREGDISTKGQFVEILDSAGSGMLNVLIGGIIGVLVAMFLIVPTMRQNDNTKAANALVSANQEAADSQNNVQTLKKRVEDLENELSNYTGKGDLQTSYEKLLEAKTSIESGDSDTASADIDVVNSELLGTKGKELYDSVYTTVNAAKIEKAYTDGYSAYKSKKYDEAAPLLQTVVDADASYEDGYALYYLAECYENIQDTEKAVAYYTQFANEHPGTKRAATAKSKVEELTGEEFVSSSQEISSSEGGE